MSLAPGRSLSHYRLVAPLGEGGMGVVWRATDSTLGRDAAIKLLPEFLSADPERLARFEREARLLAALNHPHVAGIYGFHEDGGVRFLAMELVEGEDLAQRLARGPIPVAEALPIALQVAQALEHAHEKGVIHRDLKPANVKLTAGGQAKVLDFGLAKALEDEAGRAASTSSAMSVSPTITGHLTSANVLLGTAAYMAPEQARGQVADRRADIWGFGVLLMEMLTARRTFEGETISDTLASVLKTDPDWTSLPADTPPRVRALLRRCLERDAKRRLRDIGEARILLEDVLAGRGDEAAAAAPAAAPSRRLPLLPVALATLAIGAAAVYGLTRFEHPKTGLPLRKFQLTTPGEASGAEWPRISPDGKRAAYLQGDRIVIQPLDGLEPRTVNVETGASRLFWSPDGQYVGYIAGTRILKVRADGSEPVVVCDTRGSVSSGGWGACWKEDGMIVFSRGDSAGYLEVPSDGGDPRVLLRPDSSETDLHEPGPLPGDRGLVFVAHSRTKGLSGLWLWARGRRTLLLELRGQTLADPVYSSTGHIVFERGPTTPGLWALPFSLSRLKATGEPFLVVPDATRPSVAADGTLSYLAGSSNVQTQLVWVDATGKELGTIGPPEANAGWDIALSPDGRRVARALNDQGNGDLFIYDTQRGTRTRLTFAQSSDEAASWSPDGNRIAHHLQLEGHSGGSGFYAVVRNADGTGLVDTLGPGADARFTPDGRHVVMSQLERGAAFWNLIEVPTDAPHTERMLVRGNPRVASGMVSPAGDLMAYMSIESDRWEVFLTRYPACDGKWQVSTAGGQWPRWNQRGDRLYFAQGDDIMAVDVGRGAGPVLGTPRKLFTRYPLGTGAFNWVPSFDVNADGTRFTVVRGAQGTASVPRVTLVQNWYAEFERRGGRR